MNISTLVFLQVHPISERDCARFDFAYLQKHGFAIRVFQIAALLDLAVGRHAALRNENVDVVNIDSYQQFEAAVAEAAPDSLFLTLTQTDDKMSRVLATLVDAGAHYAQLILGLLPPFVFTGNNGVESSEKPGRSGLLSPHGWARKLSTAKQQLANSVRLRRCVPDMVVVTGERGLELAEARWDAATLRERMVFSNCLDYDLFLEHRARPPQACQPYCVFIDDGFLNHAELDMFSDLAPSPQRYQREITSFFDLVEKQTKMPVKIALSPRSSLDLGQLPFGEREVFRGHTPDLIAQCHLVLAHCSTAIGLAVLFEKPVMLLETDELINTRWGPIRGFAAALDCEVTNISRVSDIAGIDWSACDRFSASHYDSYRRNYLSAPTAPPRRFWEIFADALALRFSVPEPLQLPCEEIPESIAEESTP